MISKAQMPSNQDRHAEYCDVLPFWWWSVHSLTQNSSAAISSLVDHTHLAQTWEQQHQHCCGAPWHLLLQSQSGSISPGIIVQPVYQLCQLVSLSCYKGDSWSRSDACPAQSTCKPLGCASLTECSQCTKQYIDKLDKMKQQNSAATAAEATAGFHFYESQVQTKSVAKSLHTTQPMHAADLLTSANCCGVLK